MASPKLRLTTLFRLRVRASQLLAALVSRNVSPLASRRVLAAQDPSPSLAAASPSQSPAAANLTTHPSPAADRIHITHPSLAADQDLTLAAAQASEDGEEDPTQEASVADREPEAGRRAEIGTDWAGERTTAADPAADPDLTRARAALVPAATTRRSARPSASQSSRRARAATISPDPSPAASPDLPRRLLKSPRPSRRSATEVLGIRNGEA